MNNLNYGVIGNCKSAALVSSSGSIEWSCLPDFTSGSVFAKLLDKNIGGEFGFDTDGWGIYQEYIYRTNILKTVFANSSGYFEVIDFMPRYRTTSGAYHHPPEIIRFIRHLSGKPKIKVKYKPALNYAHYKTKSEDMGEYIKSYTQRGTYESIYLYTDFDHDKILEEKVLQITGDHFFLLSYNQKLELPDRNMIMLEFERTKVYWLDWVHTTRKYKEYTEQVLRSALVLKLLTYQKSGAILAAVTTSLPETIGEVRNWDYRFCWIRDASMIIQALINLGHFNSARRFLNFIIDIIPRKDDKIQIMYGINGEKKLTEKILDHLEGYQGSKPVRIGNAAYMQKQNDIYGVLMDVVYRNFAIFKNSLENREELWTVARSIVRQVMKNWKKPDMGIWELRTTKKHFTFSKVLSWVALDRGVKIALMLKKKTYANEWVLLRDKIHADIMKKGWNEEKKAFTQSYGSSDLDSSVLLMEPYGFISAKDPKYKNTVNTVYKGLSKNGLMYRYRNEDDFGEPKSSFVICSFWMVKALYKTGRKKEATKMFDQLLSYGNHLGLFSEDLDFESKRLLGNFPQGYSHLALIEAAMVISGETTSSHRHFGLTDED